MASISSPGIGSGLDINSIVSQLMTVERRPVAQLNQKEADYQARLTAYGTFKGTLSSFQSAMRGLSNINNYQGRTASSGNSEVFTATASTGAVAGNYSVEVVQRASAQKLASQGFNNTSDAVGTGTLTLQFGTWDGAVFTANGDKPAQNIVIDSAHASVAGVRDAINNARAGVTATIVNNGTNYQLLITSNDTGKANSLKITVSDSADASNTDNAGLSQLAYDPAGSLGNGKNLSQTVAAQNAILNVDGINGIEKAGNVVTDVIDGVTLNLVGESTAGPTTLTVAQDNASVMQAVTGFVKAYNDLNKTLKDLTGYDPVTKTGSVLQGDTALLTVMSQVRRMLGGSLGSSNGYSNLSQIGVSFQRDGSLALDSGKLQQAMTSNFSDIAGLFASFGTSSDPQIRFVSANDSTRPGQYDVSIGQQATRGYRNGVATAALADSLVAGTFDSALVIDTNNDTFSIKVDGAQSGTIILNHGSYTTGASLAAEIQSKINADSALKTAGAKVSVSYDSANDRLVMTSSRYGSASKVEIVTIDTNTAAGLGLTVGASTAAGVDVAGTINGSAGIGDGRSLTGAPGNDVYGLKLEVTGGTSATLRYSRGFASRLVQMIQGVLDNNGTLDSRIDGLNASIKNIGEQREAMNRRLEQTEQRLRAQFVALDGLVAQLRSTSDYLTRQLANLPGAQAKG